MVGADHDNLVTALPRARCLRRARLYVSGELWKTVVFKAQYDFAGDLFQGRLRRPQGQVRPLQDRPLQGVDRPRAVDLEQVHHVHGALAAGGLRRSSQLRHRLGQSVRCRWSLHRQRPRIQGLRRPRDRDDRGQLGIRHPLHRPTDVRGRRGQAAARRRLVPHLRSRWRAGPLSAAPGAASDRPLRQHRPHRRCGGRQRVRRRGRDRAGPALDPG